MCARNAATLQAAAAHIRQQYNAEVLAEPFDVTDPTAVHDFVEAVVSRFGSADICVTNAGGPPAKGFLATTVDDWRKAIDANFMSTVYFAREVIPHMQKKNWGRIITITSITTKQPVADLVLSNAVRAAVVGLVKSLANEFGKDGILVNNVGPGFTATDRLKELAKVTFRGIREVRAGNLRWLGGRCLPEAPRRTPRSGRHDRLARLRSGFLHHRSDHPCRRRSLQGTVISGDPS